LQTLGDALANSIGIKVGIGNCDIQPSTKKRLGSSLLSILRKAEVKSQALLIQTSKDLEDWLLVMFYHSPL
jgi:hypothetical protein